MSDHAKQEAAPAEGHEKPSGGGIIPWIAVGVISAGLGSALPFMLAGQNHASAGEDAEHAAEEGEASGHGESASEAHGAAAGAESSHGTASKKQKKVKAFTLPQEEETVFLPFGEAGKDQEIVVNLDEGRMSRYLRWRWSACST